jgi:hypothetical protein
MGHREDLLRLFRLGPEDLEANRRGMLSQRQARYLVQRGVRNLLGSLVIGLALAAILYAVASKPLAPIQWILAAAPGLWQPGLGCMNLRVDELLNADRYYTTAAGRPNPRVQPMPLDGRAFGRTITLAARNM